MTIDVMVWFNDTAGDVEIGESAFIGAVEGCKTGGLHNYQSKMCQGTVAVDRTCRWW